MKYRKFGRLDWDVSVLGFGVMRLPHVENEYGEILEDRAAVMLHHAIDNGVNYLDSAWNYHEGNSEVFLGKALQGGYREKIRLATKMPSWKIEKTEDFDVFFDEQMERLRTDRIDFYLLHALQRDWWDRLKDLGVREWADRKMADGVIGHMGFSFHDKFPLLERIVDEYDNWTLALLMYNYMDIDYQTGRRGIGHVFDNGLAVAVMEPMKGGLLAKKPPESVSRLFSETPVQRTPVDWALQWLWSQDEVSVVLSGMSTMEQLDQNIASACSSQIGLLNADEMEFLGKVRTEYMKKVPIPCTDCRYCLPCPQGVVIPRVFEYYNMAAMYEDLGTAKGYYRFLGEKNDARLCNSCGNCEKSCPQHIEIIDWLKKAHSLLSPES